MAGSFQALQVAGFCVKKSRRHTIPTAQLVKSGIIRFPRSGVPMRLYSHMNLLDFILDRWEAICRAWERLGDLKPPKRGASSAARPGVVSASDAFTPTRPRSGARTLVGREAEIARILEAIMDENAHVVLYSERGRGKTSLSNLVADSFRKRGAIVARHTCDANSDFDSMMRGLMRNLAPSLLSIRPMEAGQEGCEAALPTRHLRPADIPLVIERLTCPFVLFLVDEFDRIQDTETRTKLADTIKILSDHAIRMHFMIVGVSATLEQIIGQHPSIQRNIVAIHLPLLTDDEIALMLEKGGRQAGLQFSEEAKELVVFVARGMPYMAQLLGLRVTQAALRRAATSVIREDLVSAVNRLLDEAGSGVLMIYRALTESEVGEDMHAVLRRLATARQDERGRMSIVKSGGDVVVGGIRLTQEAWSLLIAAGALAPPDGDGTTTQILDRPLFYHVQLLAARERLIEASPRSADTLVQTSIA